MSTEDIFDFTYKYAWSKDSSMTLEDFLSKYRPSMVQNDGTKPWIWLHGRNEPTLADADIASATAEAGAYLKEVTERVESIKNDPAIPVRSNKKTGAKSKKEVREQVQAEAVARLKEIAIKHKHVCGKWLIFAAADKVDMIWKNVATSLASGPLAETTAFQAKVATSPGDDNPHYQHVICIYLPDVFDKDAVTKVMRVLLRNHGLNLSGVKADIYTHLGIDSKHPSGIQSTIWKNTALMSDSEIKELKDAFFSGKSENPKESEEGKTDSKQTPTQPVEKKPAPKAKTGPKLKKKARADDPFASDDDSGETGDAKPTETKKAPTPTEKKAAPKTGPKLKKKVDDTFASDDEEEVKPVEKKKGKATKRPKADSDEELSESEERKKKPRGRR